MGKARKHRHERRSRKAQPVRTRRWWIVPLLLAALVAAGGTTWWWRRQHRPSPPAFLLISIDTLRADHLGCYGYGPASTPTIDRLAADGVLFEQVVSSVPITLPSHATMLTGLIPPRHGVRDNSTHTTYRLPESIDTLAEALQREGFQTGAFIGALPLLRSYGLAQGFDHYDDDMSERALDRRRTVGRKERDAKDVFDAAAAWLARTDKGRPVFCFIHLYDPHSPYIRPMPGASSPSYDGEVAYVDRMLASFLSELRSDWRWRSMVTLLTSDHGEGLGDHGEDTHCLLVYESTLRVPLIINGLQNVAPTRVHQPVALIDVAPTILALAGAPPLANVDGMSLVGAWSGKDMGQRAFYFESLFGRLRFGWAPLRGIRRGSLKYTEAPRCEFFDLSNDPKELSNLCESRSSEWEPLAQLLRRIGPGEHATLAQRLDRHTQAALESLGYVSAPPVDDGQAAPRQDPKDQTEVLDRFQAAHTAFMDGRLQDSLEIYAALEPALNRSPHFYSRWGVVASRAEQWELSNSCNRKCLALDPSARDARLNLGVGLLKTGHPQQAVREFERLLSQDPNNVEAHLYTGLVKRDNLGDLEGAIPHLRRFLELAPNHPKAEGIRRDLAAAGLHP